MEFAELSRIALEMRKLILEMVYTAGSGHLGGSLSAVEIMSCLYFHTMNIDPANPTMPERDRFILSKGHATPVYYSALAMRGFFPSKDLFSFRQLGSYLQGHPDMKKIPGVDMSSGSLGQGISVAVGMALAAKLDRKNHRIFTLVGDGELQEGQVWEALMFAAHKKLNNLVVIIDNNGVQSDGPITDINSPYPIDDKLRAFNFNVKVIDGHDLVQIEEALSNAGRNTDKPTAIIAKTVKGKGVSFMEGQSAWHGRIPSQEEYMQAMRELENEGEAKC